MRHTIFHSQFREPSMEINVHGDYSPMSDTKLRVVTQMSVPVISQQIEVRLFKHTWPRPCDDASLCQPIPSRQKNMAFQRNAPEQSRPSIAWIWVVQDEQWARTCLNLICLNLNYIRRWSHAASNFFISNFEVHIVSTLVDQENASKLQDLTQHC